ncbi:hypothetical protein WCX49_02490 [Sulfurimonas sp. HSL-1656]|uniref:hypothetical protein n=1 Tax=Thiomicrolovo subterrani TaxID=3131934 RepID=UPI0031F98BB8
MEYPESGSLLSFFLPGSASFLDKQKRRGTKTQIILENTAHAEPQKAANSL